MATRLRTIEYAFPLSTTNTNSATARDFTSITIYIPNTPSFKSVILEMGGSNWNGITSITAVLMGISLGAVARSDNTVTQTITNSGEDFSFIFTRDVTDYFVNNWTGTNMSAGARLTITGVATTNCYAKLIITYTFDDTSATTRVKTVRIPIEGNKGALTTTLTAVGGVTNNIPNLSTYLPENSVVIRDLFFETYCHTGRASGTNDRALNLRFNGTTTLAATYEGGGTTDYSIKRIDKSLTLFNTGATATLEASTANVDMPFTCLGGILYVTYEYNHTNSTTILNSVICPMIDGHGWVSNNSTPPPESFNFSFQANEPNPSLTSYSGVLVSLSDSGALAVNLFDGVTDRYYQHPATVRSGSVFQTGLYTLNIDSENKIYYPFEIFTSGTTLGTWGSNLTGCVYLNYTSDKYVDGDGCHNQTTIWCTTPYFVETSGREFLSPTTVPIGLGNYYDYFIQYAGFQINLITTSTPTSNIPISFKYYGPNFDYIPFFDTMYISDDEIGMSIMWANSTNVFLNGLEIDGVPNKLRIDDSYSFEISNFPGVCYFQLMQIVTYNCIQYVYSGNTTGVDPNLEVSYILVYNSSFTVGSTFTSGSTYEIKYPLNTGLAYVLAEVFVDTKTYVARSESDFYPAPHNINFITGEYGYGVG